MQPQSPRHDSDENDIGAVRQSRARAKVMLDAG
jgi:hypothetical protein